MGMKAPPTDRRSAWRALVARGDDSVTLPWLGGSVLRSATQTWTLVQRPREHGWYRFAIDGRKAKVVEPAEAQPGLLFGVVRGYLVGDRVVLDGVQFNVDASSIIERSEQVYLLEAGLDRFARVAAGRISDGEPLVFKHSEMPLGPEQRVLAAYLDRKENIDDVKDVAPALDAAFRMESWQRTDVERRRAEAERLRREDEERRAKEERRRELAARLGDGAGRRAMAAVDFEAAARAALAVSGAELLDHRSISHGEHIVRYRVGERRFECVCDERLSILDSGICLRNEVTGFVGDRLFTLESLPAVVLEAIRLQRLVVFRHV